MGRARVLGTLLIVAAASVAVAAEAQVSEGLKRAGPVPYVELYGRRAVKTPARPRPRPSRKAARPPTAVAAAAAAPTASAPTASGPTPAPPPPRPPAAHPGPAPPRPAQPAAAPVNATGAPWDAAAAGAFVDGAVAQAQASAPLAGVAVAVVQNGQVLLEKGYGQASDVPRRPVDPGATLFRLGSVSKVLTWIAALKAVEAGELRLDAPIDEALPPALRPPAEGFRKPITLRLLMEHAAGFEAREFGRLYQLDPDRRLPLAVALERDRPRRVRAPGELPSYSSYDAALAGAMLETATHRPFQIAIAQAVTDPLALRATTFAEPGAAAGGGPPLAADLESRLATGHVRDRAGLRPLSFEYASLRPGLAASSTADDMARLMLALLGGGRAPGAAVSAWGPATAAALEGRGGGWRSGAGGLMRYTLAGGREGFGHEGATLGSRAKLLVVPSLGLGVFVAANSDTAERLVRRLPEALVARFAPAPDPAPAPPPAAFDGRRYAGLYLSTRRAYHGLEGFVDRLTRLHRVRADGGAGRLVVTGPGGARTFEAGASADSFQAADGGGARLVFLPGRGGRAGGFQDPGGFGAAERVGWLHRPATLAVFAATALLAALLALTGPLVRVARDLRQSPPQARANILQAGASLLWLAATGAFTVFAVRATDPVRLYTVWPDPWLAAASWLALAAAAASLAQVVQLRGVWADARRVQGWTGWRKLRHTLTVLAFLAFAVVLASWGALEPWSG